jgi:hypothetical protein
LKQEKMRQKQKYLDGGASETQRGEIENSFYVVRFHDCECAVCCPRNDMTVESSVISEIAAEEKFTRKYDLNVRTSWKILGKQFNTGKYIIGIGAIESGQRLIPGFYE